MRRVFLVVVLLLARISVASADSERSEPYVQALQVANSFLYSWVQRDVDGGLRLMSANLLKTPPDSTASDHDSWLRLYMSGLSNPHHQAFEIHAGTTVRADRIAFPVTLYEIATGQRSADVYSSSIELVRETDGWRVARLPRSSDNK